MMFRSAFSRLLLACAALQACCLFAFAADAPRVAGKVVNAHGDVPIRHAEVLLRSTSEGHAEYLAASDSGGLFHFDSLPPGEYTVLARKDGYERSRRFTSSAGAGRLLSVGSATAPDDLLIRMLPTAVIEGRVFDLDGDPITSAPVVALVTRHQFGVRHLVPVRTGSTDDRGEFRVYGLPAGEYFLAVTQTKTRERERLRGVNVEDPFSIDAPAFYPGTTDLIKAAPIAVCPGEELRREFPYPVVTTVTVRGRLNAESGHAVISLVPDELESGTVYPSYLAQLDRKRNFMIRNVAPGDYQISATQPGRTPSYAFQSLTVTSGSDVEGIILTPTEPSELSGKLTAEGGSDKAHATQFEIALMPKHAGGGSVQRATAKPGGRFAFPVVVPGEYYVTATPAAATAEWYVAAITLGAQDVLRTGLDARSTLPGADLRIVVAADGATLTGVAVSESDAPFTGAKIVLIPDEARRGQPQFYYSTDADASGRFTVHGIAPGDYDVFAFESYYDPATAALGDEDRASQYPELARSVRLGAGERKDLQLTVIDDRAARRVGSRQCSDVE